jgi:cytidylate kinase
MYRATTLRALREGVPLDDGGALGEVARAASIDLRERDHDYVQVLLDGEDVSEEIRSPRVTGASSQVAAHEQVRSALLGKQRELIDSGDYVVEGRDIGTVVAPDAPVKAFLTADPAERARRRAAELERRGLEAQADEVRRAIEQRDLLDSTRSAAPLRAADDAVEIDTTGLSPEQVVDRIVDLFDQARAPAERKRGQAEALDDATSMRGPKGLGYSGS